MKHLRILLMFLFSLLLAACETDGLYSLTISTEGEHELTQNIQGDLLVLGGNVSLPQNNVVDGNVHLLLGKFTVNGEITGDVSFINGELILGPSARIGGNLNLGGGSFHRSPNSVVDGVVNTGAGVSLPSVSERETPSDWSFWLRAIINGFTSGLIAAALVWYFPTVVHRISEAITHHTLASGGMGVLVGIVGISLVVTMAYTILLIPVSILILFLLAAGVFMGWIGLGSELGRILVQVSKRPISPSMAAFLGTLIFMPVFQLLTSIPLLGGLLGITLAAVGLGSISLTRFGLRRFIPVQEETWPPGQTGS